MSEGGMRSRLVRALRPLDAVAVENPAYPGTPDINCIAGWIECKWLRAWPTKLETPINIDHYTPQQRIWLRRRWRAGGGAWLILQCKRDWLVFTGEQAMDVLKGQHTREETIAHATQHWANGLNDEELLQWLNSSLTR